MMHGTERSLVKRDREQEQPDIYVPSSVYEGEGERLSRMMSGDIAEGHVHSAIDALEGEGVCMLAALEGNRRSRLLGESTVRPAGAGDAKGSHQGGAKRNTTWTRAEK